VDVVHIDVMDMVTKLYTDAYMGVVRRHPAQWGYWDDKTDHQKQDSRLRRMQLTIERLSTKRLKKALREMHPDAVVCTHFLPAQLLSRMAEKREFDKPVWVQVIVMSPIPGQEERDADYLLEHGACLKTLDVTGLEYRMRRMLSEPGLIDKMAARAKGISRPTAAR
jgi:UDP-N-acetylglucosamine:LPS N-acetylglucosamine transferase